jgi:F-type H+-transporting ATPase subunit b
VNINYTIIGQLLSFAVFVWFCAKYVWPPLTAAMSERSQKIADGLSAAERAAKDLELAQNDAIAKLKEAKAQAAVILEQANKRAASIIADGEEKGDAERTRIVDAAKAEVEMEVNRAREELRSKVSTLAIAGAEKILGASVDAQAHSTLLEKLAAEL